MDFKKREEVVDTVLSAFTAQECLDAEKLLQDWLRDNPQDWGMYDLVSTLATVKSAAVEDAQEAPAGVSEKAAV